MQDALEYYKILQVSPDADIETIKHSYRDLAKMWHPDYNKDKDTTDIFQKLSVAYDVLSDEKSRLIYDILSIVYGKDNYPDIEAMTAFKDGAEGINLRAVTLKNVRAWFVSFKLFSNLQIVSYKKALRLNACAALSNWLAGWWHPKAFFKNLQALKSNFIKPLSKEESLRILIHNMIAYANNNQNVEALKCGLQAYDLAASEDKKLLDKFFQTLNVKVKTPKAWNIAGLKLVQLVMPVFLLILLLFPAADKYVNLSEAELWSIFSDKKEIDYYQRVKFGGGRESVDDVVVGKIVSVPVDKSDTSKLYHLTTNVEIMYGPSDDFDVIKTLEESTTVRLTGYTPDNVWARVMMDNGETGFVHTEDIKPGIGKEIPFGSAIIE